MKSNAALIAILVATSALGGCSPSASPSSKQAQPDAASVGRKQDRNDRLLAAAEPYEALTEAAFGRPLNELETMRATAANAVAPTLVLLLSGDSSQIDKLDAEIKDALRADSRPSIAIAAVESYKILVNAQDASAVPPKEVSLLDYAGFRYDALSKSTPTPWAEMAATTAYGVDVWALVKPSVSDAALTAKFDAALVAMNNANAVSDVAAARSAVARELALVDDLEVFFSGGK